MKTITLRKSEKAQENLRRFMFEHPEFGNQSDAINAILEGLYEDNEKKNLYSCIRESIRNLQTEYGLEVPEEEIFTNLMDRGYSKDEIENAITIMKRDGILYSPDK